MQAEYQAGREGRPSPAEAQRRRPVAPAQRPAGPPWWEVLRLPRTASLKDAIAAYRDGISKNHPDKVAHLSDALRQVAERETRRLNAAYEEAKRFFERKS